MVSGTPGLGSHGDGQRLKYAGTGQGAGGRGQSSGDGGQAGVSRNCFLLLLVLRRFAIIREIRVGSVAFASFCEFHARLLALIGGTD